MEKLLEYLNAERGRRLSLANALGIKPSAVSQWRRVPVDRLAKIESLTGIPRQHLRPEIFAETGVPATGLLPVSECVQ